MDIGASNWTEDDDSNSTAAPDGAPEGMAPGGVNDTLRAMMGALKRWWNQNVPKATSGTSTAYTLSYTVAPGALVDGMTHLVQFHTASGASPTLNVNSLGAQSLYKWQGAWVQVTAAGDLPAGFVARVAYNQSVGCYRILRPIGTAADYHVGTGANNVVKLDDNGAMPSVPGAFQTGMRVGFTGKASSVPSGWVMSRGNTIGDASSNATERDNADTQALFTLWYDDGSDDTHPIVTSGGAATTRAAQGTAAAAFAAHCQLTMPNYTDRFVIGMGGISTNPGETGGASTVTLDVTNLPPHEHTAPGTAHTFNNNQGGGGLPNYDAPGPTGDGSDHGLASTPFSVRNPYISEPQIVKL